MKFTRDWHTTSDRKIAMTDPKSFREAFNILVGRSGHLEETTEQIRMGGEHPHDSEPIHVL